MSITTVVLLWMVTLQPSAPWKGTYAETAQGIVDACDGEVSCAATLTAIAYHESRFRQDALGDHGRSVGLFQIQGIPRGLSAEAQARKAKRMVERSFIACGDLTWYVSGRCNVGRYEARERSRLALALSAP